MKGEKMEYEFDISIVKKNKGYLLSLGAFICFLISAIIILFYSYRVSLSMMIVVMFLCARFVRKYRSNITVTYHKVFFTFGEDGFCLEIIPHNSEYTGKYSFEFANLKEFRIFDDGKVIICSPCRNQSQCMENKKIIFFLTLEDKDRLKRIIESYT